MKFINKSLFVIAIVISSCLSTNSENTSNLKKITLSSGRILEMKLDSPKEICSYEEAQKIVKKIGGGWRLPTKIELIDLRYNGGLSSFDISTYWSATQIDKNLVYVYNFYTDKCEAEYKVENNYVMLVR